MLNKNALLKNKKISNEIREVIRLWRK
jgi:hypothetical protein